MVLWWNISEHLLLLEDSSQSPKSTLSTSEHTMTRWRSGAVKMWKCHSGSDFLSDLCFHRSTFFHRCPVIELECFSESGVAVWGSARDHPLFCGGPRFPHKEPPHLPQGHRGDHSQPGSPSWSLDGWLQDNLLSAQQECSSYGQGGQCYHNPPPPFSRHIFDWNSNSVVQ